MLKKSQTNHKAIKEFYGKWNCIYGEAEYLRKYIAIKSLDWPDCWERRPGHGLIWGCCYEQEPGWPCAETAPEPVASARALLEQNSTENCTKQHHLSGVALRCAYLPKPQDLEGFCGGCLAACIWSFSRGRMCGFTTYRALSPPTAQPKDQGHNKQVWNGNEDLHANLQIAWISKRKNKSKWKKTHDVTKMTPNIMRKECFISKLRDN